MRQHIGLILICLGLALVSSPAAAQEEPSPSASVEPAQGATIPATPFLSFLDGVIAALSTFQPQYSGEYAVAASMSASRLRDVLVAVRPHECYVDAYLREWDVYAELHHTATSDTAFTKFMAPRLVGDTLDSASAAMDTAADACVAAAMDASVGQAEASKAVTAYRAKTPTFTEFTELAADSLGDLDATQRKSAREAARSLRQTLLAVTPDPCYVSTYAAYWGVASTLRNIANEKDKEMRGFLIDRLPGIFDWVAAALYNDAVTCSLSG